MGSTCLQIPINENNLFVLEQITGRQVEKYAQLRFQQKQNESSSQYPDEQIEMTNNSIDENNNSLEEISFFQKNQSPAKTCKGILKNKNDLEYVRSNGQNKTVSFSFIPTDQLKEMLTSQGRLSEEQRKFLASLHE
ncbi:unnamed protein product [Paramecium sonneborni]|uniref:Uncharacterized protein n=1 Tax=Paramecium sonneborni TaxID=65129 RepID=A0A8S1RFR3_9CILI|nr:unnamed protein product [Paramecium sonneborni]